MIDIDLSDEIRDNVENELDCLIKHIDQFQEEWRAQADINRDGTNNRAFDGLFRRT